MHTRSVRPGLTHRVHLALAQSWLKTEVDSLLSERRAPQQGAAASARVAARRVRQVEVDAADEEDDGALYGGLAAVARLQESLSAGQVAERAALAEVLRIEERGLHAANDKLARAARLDGLMQQRQQLQALLTMVCMHTHHACACACACAMHTPSHSLHLPRRACTRSCTYYGCTYYGYTHYGRAYTRSCSTRRRAAARRAQT